MSYWISVKDRLPNPDVQVLVHPAGPLPVRWVKSGGEWFFDAFPVTHWFPMPRPPMPDDGVCVKCGSDDLHIASDSDGHYVSCCECDAEYMHDEWFPDDESESNDNSN